MLVLKKAQQHDLRARCHRFDLIKQQRTTVRLCYQSAVCSPGVRKGTLFVPKQLALKQIVRQCTAIDWNEAKIPSRTQIVQCTGREFLSGTGFAEDQDSGVDLCNPLDPAQSVEE